jgi:hypothetical protein
LAPASCFAKKRLDVVENKGLALKNAEKRGCIVLKTLRWSLQRRSKKGANCSEDVAVGLQRVHHEKKNEKLEYMHANPVNRGLVRHPQDWPWSSWAFYSRSESGLIAMDRVYQ